MKLPSREGGNAFLLAALVIHLAAPQAFITAPVFVEAMVDWGGLSPAEAGYVQAAESLGKAVAAITLLFVVHHLDWRRLVRTALAVLVIGNLLSILATGFLELVAVRFICGLAPGVVVPLAYAMVGMTPQRERNFGLLLTTLLAYGTLAFTVLPWLFAHSGLPGGLLFYAGVAGVGWWFASWVPRGGQQAGVAASDLDTDSASTLPGSLRPWTVLTLALYFIGMSGAWAYFSLIADAGGVAASTTSGILAASQVSGIVGGLLVVVTGDRLGRLLPIALGLTLTIAALLLLRGPLSPAVLAVSALAFAGLWNHTHPYLLSAISSLDNSGRLVVQATVAQMCGIAVGPALAARLVGATGDYGMVVGVCSLSLGLALACILPALIWQQREARRSKVAAS